MLAVGCLMNVYDLSTYILGEGGRQLTGILVSVVPMLAFVILFRDYVRGDSTQVDRILLVIFVATRLFNGLSSGWLGVSISLIITVGIVDLAVRRTLPQGGVIVGVSFG